jgi:hypothetical protein
MQGKTATIMLKILGTNVKNLVAQAIKFPGFVHPCDRDKVTLMVTRGVESSMSFKVDIR